MDWLTEDTTLAAGAALALALGTVSAALQLLKSGATEERSGGTERARWFLGSGGYLLLLALAARGLAVGGWPFARRYDVLLLTVAALALFYALGIRGPGSTWAGVCAGLIATPTLVLTLLLTSSGVREPKPVPPLLGGIWFPIHVLATGIGYGGLALAGGTGLLQLVAGHEGPAENAFPDWEALQRQGLAWGYPWLTLGMLAGAIWSWESWGWLWSWNSKEILTLVTWGLFTLAFHTRRLSGWRGRPHAAVLTAGLVTLFLTLLVSRQVGQRALSGIEYVF